MTAPADPYAADRLAWGPGEFEIVVPRRRDIERRFDPDQLRAPKGSPIGGRWVRQLLTAARMADLYGEQIDEVEWTDGGFVSAHEIDGIVLYHDVKPDAGPDGQRYDVFVDGLDGDDARQLSDHIEDMASDAAGYDPDAPDATPASSNGLVDWTVKDGYLVGYDPNGDVMIRIVGDDADRTPVDTREQLAAADGFDIGADEADALVDALRDMARVADEAGLADEADITDEARARVLEQVEQIERSSEPDLDDEAVRALDRNRLKRYWTRGKGLAKWATKPHPWTALYRHLRKYVGSARAKRMASQWFKEVFQIWPGHRKGTNPLGPG